jgi:hypothetical protein
LPYFSLLDSGFRKRRGRPPLKHNRKAQEETEAEEEKRERSNSPESLVRRRAGRPKLVERSQPPSPTNDDDAPRRSPRSQRGSSPSRETDEAEAGDKHGDEDETTPPPVPPPRKRGPGRPPRQRPAGDAAEGSKPNDSHAPNEEAGFLQSETNAATDDLPESPPRKRRRGRPPYKHLLKSNQDVVEDSKPNGSHEPNEEAEVVQSEVKHGTEEQESSNSAEKSTGPSIANDAAKKSSADAEDPPVPPTRKRRGRPPYKHLLQSNQDVADDSKPNGSKGPKEDVVQSEVKRDTQEQDSSQSEDVAQSSKVERDAQQSKSSTIAAESTNSSLSKPGRDSAAGLPSPPRKKSEAVPSLYSMVKRRRAAGRTEGRNDDMKPKSVEESDGTLGRIASARDEGNPVDMKGKEKASIVAAGMSMESETGTRDEEDAVQESGKIKDAANNKDPESLGEAQGEDVDAQQNEESKEAPAGRGSNARGRGRSKNTRRSRPKRSCVRGQQEDDDDEGEAEGEESDD